MRSCAPDGAAAGRGPRAGITHLEIKSGYGLDVEAERRALRDRGGVHRRRHVAGRDRAASSRAVPTTTSSCVRADLERLRAVRPLDRRVLRGGSVRRRPVARPCSRPAGRRASGCGSTGTSSAPVRASGWRSRRAPPRSTTAPTSTTATSRRSRQRHRRDVPARDRFLHPPALSRRPPRDRRRGQRCDRHQHQPGLVEHDRDGLLHRARRARDGHDVEEAVAAATLGGAGRCAATTWAAGPGGSGRRRDPRRPHVRDLVYRPGVPVVAATVARAHRRSGSGREPEAAHAALVPQVWASSWRTVLDLGAEQIRVVAEVALERVLEDHDPVRIAVAGDVAPMWPYARCSRPLLETVTGVCSRTWRKSSGRSLGPHHEIVELARWVVGGRHRGQGLAAVHEARELGLRHLLTGQRDDRPRRPRARPRAHRRPGSGFRQTPSSDGGLRSRRSRPAMNALRAAARRGGARISRMRLRLRGRDRCPAWHTVPAGAEPKGGAMPERDGYIPGVPC